MNRFWIILAVVVLGLGALFVITKPKEDSSSAFTGDAAQVQSDDHIRNGKDKKVTLIEYGDFECPACGSAYPVIKELEEIYKDTVSFGFRHYPIISAHPNAFSAARAAEAASKQGKFFEMHDKLYETQSVWASVRTNQQELFEGYAKELNLEIATFKTDYVSEAVANRINRDVSSAKQFNITGTPTFILIGKKIETPNGIDGFKTMLNEAIKNSGGTLPEAAQ